MRDLAAEFSIDLRIRLEKLQKLGVLILKGQIKLATYEGKGYALVYNGEVIVQGTTKELIAEVWDIWKKAGKEVNIASYLDGLLDIGILLKNKNFQDILAEVRIGRKMAKYLTIHEEAVLRFYTTNPGYKNLNKALRGDKDVIMTETFLAQERLMNRALDKLPISVYNNSEALLYRIEYLSAEQIESYYKIGTTIKNKHFTSATYDYDAIGEAMLRRPYTVLIRIRGKNGKLIEDLSTLKKEKEILFTSKTEFYVKNIGVSNNPSDFASPIKTIILIEK